MTSSIYAHIWPTSNRLLGFNTYRTSYMYDLFILSNSYLRSKNSPIRTKGIQYIRASDLIQLFLPINSIFYMYIKYGDPGQTGIATILPFLSAYNLVFDTNDLKFELF